MKALLIKDAMLLKNQKRFLIIVIVFMFMFGFVSHNYSFMIAYTCMMLSIFTISTISYDEFENGNMYLFSLPVSRKVYVVEKYVFGFCAMIVALLGVSAVILAEKMIASVPYSAEEWKVAIVVSIVVTTIMLILTIPSQLRFGADKGRIVLMMVAALVVLVAYIAGKLLEKVDVDLSVFAEKLERMGMIAFVLLGGLCLIMILISVCISFRVIEKKEF